MVLGKGFNSKTLARKVAHHANCNKVAETFLDCFPAFLQIEFGLESGMIRVAGLAERALLGARVIDFREELNRINNFCSL